MQDETISYAEPVNGCSADDCFFYHRMDLPGVGEVGGHWDLRPIAGDYLGNVDFRGKRVLDVGAASGFLSFEMEKRGAEVVSFDMVDGRSWNLVPQAVNQGRTEKILEDKARCHQQLRNAYWFTHQRLGSSARAFYGDIYHLPVELGKFDVVFLGMILGHLQDPFQALYSASRLTDGQIVITNQAERPGRKKEPRAVFMPNRENRAIDCWWALSAECLEEMLGVLGFAVDACTYSHPQCLVQGRVGQEKCATVIAHRVEGYSVALDPPTIRPARAA